MKQYRNSHAYFRKYLDALIGLILSVNIGLKKRAILLMLSDLLSLVRGIRSNKLREISKRMDFNPRKTCTVCYDEAKGNKSHGEHYGAVCCHNCRSFFRRTIQTHGQKNWETFYKCDSNNTEGQRCDMKEYGRNHRCAKCRLAKCIDIGMDPLKVIIDPEFRQRFKGEDNDEP